MMKRNLMVVGLALMLGACGFQLRGTGTSDFALNELNVQARNAFGQPLTMCAKALATTVFSSQLKHLTHWLWYAKKKTLAPPVTAM